MDKKVLESIVKTWFKMSEKDASIKKFFDTNEYYFGNEIWEIQEFILSYVGIPEDTCIELVESDDKWFSRDWYHEQFYLCQDGKISVSDLVEILIQEGETFRNIDKSQK